MSSPPTITPHLTPSTPQAEHTPEQLQTPSSSNSQHRMEQSSVGLGFGDVGGKEGRVEIPADVSLEPNNVAPPPSSASPQTSNTLRTPEVAEDDDEISSIAAFPEDGELRGIKRRLDEMTARDRPGDGRIQQDELVGIVRRLLEPAIQRLPFLLGQIEAQRETITAMQQQSRLSEQLTAIERDRHIAERASWHTETRALLNMKEAEIAAGTRSKKLELDVGYHQELEAANKRLEMDNRLMAPRLIDTQRQIDKLVTELRHLRPLVLLSTQPLAEDAHPPQLATRARSPQRSLLQSTMGDARTEHLLLAARKVRLMRAHDDRVGRLTLEELKRGGVIGPDGGLGYSEGYGGVIEEDEDSESDVEDEETRRPGAAANAKAPPPPSTPLLKSSKKSKRQAPPSTPSRPHQSQQPETTPGGSNFNDLLRAAELATRPGTPSPSTTPAAPSKRRDSAAVPPATSATRSTTRRDRNESPEASPSKKPRTDNTTWHRRNTSTVSASGAAASDDSRPTSATPAQTDESALDLLIQASQLEEPTVPPPAPTERERESTPTSSLGPAIDLRNPPSQSSQPPQIDPILTAQALSQIMPPPQTPDLRSAPSQQATPETPRNFYSYGYDDDDEFPGKFEEAPPGAFAVPTGATVPGLGKYVHLSSSMPARRMRSPYLKWTVEEDELLARAVAMHGEKWDLVSKGVPTRSYHQVRQRWLRKTGAFDKKPLSGQMNFDSEMGGGEGGGSPTPGEGKVKKRKMSHSS